MKNPSFAGSPDMEWPYLMCLLTCDCTSIWAKPCEFFSSYSL